MTANASRSQSVSFETESAWAESTDTFGTRLQTSGFIDVSSLEQAMVDYNPTVQFQNDGDFPIRGVYGGSFTIELMLTGRGSASSGAVSLSDLMTLLGHSVGASAVAASTGDTVSGGASTTTVFDTTGASGFGAGTLCRVGALADSGAEGQFYAVVSHAGSQITVLNAAPAAPAAAAVVYAPDMAIAQETPGTAESVTSLRFRLLSGNKQYTCRGCWCSAVRFTGLNPGEIPRVSLDFMVSYFTEVNVTFPDVTATTAGSGTPVAAGSFFLQTVGTTTRAVFGVRAFALTIDMQTTPLMGPGGPFARQVIVGARRTLCKASFDATFDQEATGTNTFVDIWDTDENSQVYKHVLYTLSAEDGRALAFYFPQSKIMGNRPTQVDLDGLNRVPTSWSCDTGPTTTNETTLSNWRLASA